MLYYLLIGLCFASLVGLAVWLGKADYKSLFWFYAPFLVALWPIFVVMALINVFEAWMGKKPM